MPALKLSTYENTIPQEEYLHLISDRCCACPRRMKKNAKRYLINGNFCKKCCVRSEEAAKARKLTEKELDEVFRNKFPVV